MVFNKMVDCTNMNLKPTGETINTKIGLERVYVSPKGTKYIVIGNKAKEL